MTNASERTIPGPLKIEKLVYVFPSLSVSYILLDKEDPAPRCIIDNQPSENGPEETRNSKHGTQNAGVKANFFDSNNFGDDDEYGGVDARAADTLQCAKDNPMKQK